MYSVNKNKMKQTVDIDLKRGIKSQACSILTDNN